MKNISFNLRYITIKNTGFVTFFINKSCIIVVIFFILLDCAKSNDGDDQHITWKNYGGGSDQSKYVDFDQINKSNVKDLEVAWFYSTGDTRSYQFNPLIAGNTMYVLAKNSSLVALNATTGEEIWIHANLSGIARKGINYWESEDGKDKRLIFQINGYLQAIDASTGKSILSFGEKGLVDLRQGLDRDPNSFARVHSGNPGAIFEDLILMGSAPGEGYMSPPGYLRAYNVVTGKLEWTFHTVPKPGEYGYDTWPKDAYKYAGAINTWGEITIDKKNGIAFFPLGSPTYDYYGADRIGSNLFGNCLLALDARTGKRIWHYQTVHHDLWDYDVVAAPQLLDVNIDGIEIEAVSAIGKHGFVFVFDRHTGEPLWPIEERPVPPSKVTGEQAWPTQPFPAVLPPVSRLEMKKEDISKVFLSDSEYTEWMAKWDSLQTGLFTPLSNKAQTLSIPGAHGGVNWGSTAANSKKGIMYVIGMNYPSVYEKLRTLEEMEEMDRKSTGVGRSNSGVYQQNCVICHGADRAGLSGPSLLNTGNNYSFNQFKELMITGRADMPSFAYLKEEDIKEVYEFLTSNTNGRQRPSQKNEVPEGPVVATGGVPGGLETRQLSEQAKNSKYGMPYPEGVKVDHERLYLRGWGLEFPYIINPPWSEIMAYDMNTGKLKWKRPLGEDLEAKKMGFENSGMLKISLNGMIITSTGLVFVNSKDGNIYAFDAENGEELWKSKLPSGSIGLPAMYEENGRQYLVVPSATPVQFGRSDEKTNDESAPQGGYVVYALKSK